MIVGTYSLQNNLNMPAAKDSHTQRLLPHWLILTVAGALVLMLVAGAVGAGYGLMLWQKSLPALQGEITLPGLSQHTTTVRDEHGVPHIFADTVEDAWRVLGYLHASERMFQMDMQRRAGQGRLSEILGKITLDYDRLNRTLNFYALAKQGFSYQTAEYQKVLQAYADGVNAWIDDHQGDKLPYEFQLLNYAPEAWQPADSLVWGKLMAWQLSGNAALEALRGQLRAEMEEVDVEKYFMQLADDDPITTQPAFKKRVREIPAPPPNNKQDDDADEIQAPIILDAPTHSDEAETPTNHDDMDNILKDFEQDHKKTLPPSPTTERTSKWQALLAQVQQNLKPTWAQPKGASNHWVVDGTRTATGKPLLANDPHLGLSLPAQWFLARIVTPHYTLAGGTIPGVPLVLLGHNGRVAWGLTTSYVDTQDLFVQKVSSINSAEFQAHDHCKLLKTRSEQIKIKGSDDFVFDVQETDFGPVVSEQYPSYVGKVLDQEHIVSLSFVGLAAADPSASALYNLAYARDWPSVDETMKDYLTPSQNLLVADVDGNIAYRLIGKVPVRVFGNGRYPSSAMAGERGWRGFIPDKYMPRAVNPEGGIIFNANNRLVDVAYHRTLGWDWAENVRARRLQQLLGSKEEFSADDFSAMQMDTLSLAARDLTPYLVQVRARDARDQRILDFMRAWNGEMIASAPEPLIFSWWLRILSQKLFQGRLDTVMDELGPHSAMAVLKILQTPRPPLCDKNTGGDCRKAVTDAFYEAIDKLSAQYGTEFSVWNWGAAHVAPMKNRVLAEVPWIGKMWDKSFESDGDTYTLNRGGSGQPDKQEPFARTTGGGFRGIYDLSNLNLSRFIIAGGQSAHPLSPHYADMLDDWKNGQSITLSGTMDELKKRTNHALVFAPKND